MANASVKITIKPFTDPVPTLTSASGSGSGFQYASYGAIKSLQTTMLTDLSSGPSRIQIDPPKNPVSTNYERGTIKIVGKGNVKLHLTVVDDAVPPVSYSVASLLFTSRASAVVQFPDFTSNADGSLDLDDAFTACVSFSFLLVIQNTLGGVALVDPQISNH